MKNMQNSDIDEWQQQQVSLWPARWLDLKNTGWNTVILHSMNQWTGGIVPVWWWHASIQLVPILLCQRMMTAINPLHSPFWQTRSILWRCTCTIVSHAIIPVRSHSLSCIHVLNIRYLIAGHARTVALSNHPWRQRWQRDSLSTAMTITVYD